MSVDAAERVAAIGEPWKTRLPARELVDLLKSYGFSETFHLTRDLAQQRYFSGRADGLRVPGMEQLICGIV